MLSPLSRSIRLMAAGALVAALGIAATAQAAVACRADPLVTLSNGIQLDLYATIADNLSDVQHISYVVHGPALPASSGAPAGAITSGAGWYAVSYPDGTGSFSSLTYVPDGQPHQFYTVVTVTTGIANTAVTSYLDWVAGGKHNTGTAQVTGVSGVALQSPVLRVVCANQCTA